jgi:hypothetical protein
MPQTQWRLTQIPDVPQALEITLAVDTTAPAVVRAVEEAAFKYGVKLERVTKGCGHDGWVEGCPNCEAEHQLANRLLEAQE